MNCQEAQELFSPYLDGELEAEEKSELEGHINRCGQCTEDLAALRLAVGAIRSLQEAELSPPPYLKRRICARVEAIARRRRLSQYITWAASAAAVLLLAVALNNTFSHQLPAPVRQESKQQPGAGFKENSALPATPYSAETASPRVMKQGAKTLDESAPLRKPETPPGSMAAKAVPEKEEVAKGQTGEESLDIITSQTIPDEVPARKHIRPPLLFALSLSFFILAFLSWLWGRRAVGIGS